MCIVDTPTTSAFCFCPHPSHHAKANHHFLKPYSRWNKVEKYHYEATVLTILSLGMSVGFPATILCGLMSATFSCLTLCWKRGPSRLILIMASVCGCICAFGNLAVAVVATHLPYCQNKPINCDEKTWLILGPVAGIGWLVGCLFMWRMIPTQESSTPLLLETDSTKADDAKESSMLFRSVTSALSSNGQDEPVLPSDDNDSNSFIDFIICFPPPLPVLHLDDPIESSSNASDHGKGSF